MASVWVEAADPKTGKKYYYNKKTKKTQWQRPAELDEGGSEEPASEPVTESSPEDDRKNWAEGTDPKTGKKYFYNKQTRRTTWTRPKCFGEDGGDSGGGSDREDDEPQPQPQASPVKSKSDKPEKSSWKQAVDPKSGKPYWYNKVTKETTWKNPTPEPEVEPEADEEPAHEQRPGSESVDEDYTDDGVVMGQDDRGSDEDSSKPSGKPKKESMSDDQPTAVMGAGKRTITQQDDDDDAPDIRSQLEDDADGDDDDKPLKKSPGGGGGDDDGPEGQDEGEDRKSVV